MPTAHSTGALVLSVALCTAASCTAAWAGGAPGVITGGSGDVSIGAQPAARKGDRSDADTSLAEGSSDVFINGRPAATVGDRTGCGGITVGGASNVFINGKPAARAGDLTTGCPGK